MDNFPQTKKGEDEEGEETANADKMEVDEPGSGRAMRGKAPPVVDMLRMLTVLQRASDRRLHSDSYFKPTPPLLIAKVVTKAVSNPALPILRTEAWVIYTTQRPRKPWQTTNLDQHFPSL